jgi:hypothetical protein
MLLENVFMNGNGGYRVPGEVVYHVESECPSVRQHRTELEYLSDGRHARVVRRDGGRENQRCVGGKSGRPARRCLPVAIARREAHWNLLRNPPGRWAHVWDAHLEFRE